MQCKPLPLFPASWCTEKDSADGKKKVKTKDECEAIQGKVVGLKYCRWQRRCVYPVCYPVNGCYCSASRTVVQESLSPGHHLRRAMWQPC